MTKLTNYNKTILTSDIATHINVSDGSFVINTSGSVSAGGTVNFSGSVSIDTSRGSFNIFVLQNPVPTDVFTNYDNTTLLPELVLGSFGVPTLNNGCTVVGNPSVASIALVGSFSISSSGISAILSCTNPYSGTMTLTATIFTLSANAFAPIGV